MQQDMCPKCKGQMKKTGVLNSGNSRFQQYACSCGHKDMRAIGVNG